MNLSLTWSLEVSVTEALGFALWIGALVYGAHFFSFRYLQRHRELMADRFAANLLGLPESRRAPILAAAIRLSRRLGGNQTGTNVSFLGRGANECFALLHRTHPTDKERIEAIKKTELTLTNFPGRLELYICLLISTTGASAAIAFGSNWPLLAMNGDSLLAWTVRLFSSCIGTIQGLVPIACYIVFCVRVVSSTPGLWAKGVAERSWWIPLAFIIPEILSHLGPLVLARGKYEATDAIMSILGSGIFYTLIWGCAIMIRSFAEDMLVFQRKTLW